jgi:hypothetical protein
LLVHHGQDLAGAQVAAGEVLAVVDEQGAEQ